VKTKAKYLPWNKQGRRIRNKSCDANAGQGGEGNNLGYVGHMKGGYFFRLGLTKGVGKMWKKGPGQLKLGMIEGPMGPQ